MIARSLNVSEKENKSLTQSKPVNVDPATLSSIQDVGYPDPAQVGLLL